MGNKQATDYVIGVEIGGTKLQAALGTSSGELLHVEASKVVPGSDAEGILSWFDTSIPALLSKADAVTPVRGIGVGFGGPVNSATGEVITSHQVKGWSGFPIGKWFEERFELPVRVENDANAAGWAEYCLGAGKGTQTFCYMNIGSGIGGALILGGTLHNGQGLGAFEIGHTYVPDIFVDGPGRAVKLEDRFSGWAIEQRLRSYDSIPVDSTLWGLCDGDREAISCAMVGEAARGGDEYAADVIEEMSDYIGVALANAITLVHPEVVAVGGGVSLMGDILMDSLRAKIEGLIFTPYQGTVKIEPAQLNEDVVVVGGLLLAPIL